MASPKDISTEYEIIPIKKLKPLEQVFPTHLQNLIDMILSEQVIRLPIYVDKKTGIVLDGSHRYAIFLHYGFDEVPVRWVDYNDENVRVGTHLAHRFEINGDTNISKKEVKRRGRTGDLYPPRTTRHFFPFRKTPIALKLSQLKNKKVKRNIDHLLARVTMRDEIKHNAGFIKEIDHETKTIKEYMKEAQATKKYLQSQVKAMQKGKRSRIKRDDLFSGI